jgi:hypothetical protein
MIPSSETLQQVCVAEFFLPEHFKSMKDNQNYEDHLMLNIMSIDHSKKGKQYFIIDTIKDSTTHQDSRIYGINSEDVVVVSMKDFVQNPAKYKVHLCRLDRSDLTKH